MILTIACLVIIVSVGVYVYVKERKFEKETKAMFKSLYDPSEWED